MLRGPQTVGEIKGRTERMYGFADLDETETVLQKMTDRSEGALAQKLPHAPGTKEPRFAQTLGGPVEFAAPAHSPAPDRLPPLKPKSPVCVTKWQNSGAASTKSCPNTSFMYPSG